MPYTVYIRKNATGEIRSYTEDFDWSGDFIWSEGNFSCDCNRELFFCRAQGNDEPDVECGESKFSVRITTLDGQELYADDNWNA